MTAGFMKFLLNAAIDTLPKADSLKKWKKEKFRHVGRQATEYCLNISKVALILAACYIGGTPNATCLFVFYYHMSNKQEQCEVK